MSKNAIPDIDGKDSKPVLCQKCGKPVGYVTVSTKNILGNEVPLPNVKIVAVCVYCKTPKIHRYIEATQ